MDILSNQGKVRYRTVQGQDKRTTEAWTRTGKGKGTGNETGKRNRDKAGYRDKVKEIDGSEVGIGFPTAKHIVKNIFSITNFSIEKKSQSGNQTIKMI